MNTESYLPAVVELQKNMGSQKLYYLEKLQANEVVVVRGRFDKVENILGELKIEHKVYDGRTLSNARLSSAKVLLVNCPGNDVVPGTVEQFVSNGGWLVTTDWSLGLVETAFPRIVEGTGKRTSDDVVEICPADSMITKGMINNSQFWLEASSHVFRIIDKDVVKVLISSDELSRKYGSDNVMVGFNWGSGKVFHSISHFILQKSKSGNTRMEDAYSSLVLLTNILAQAKVKGEKL